MRDRGLSRGLAAGLMLLLCIWPGTAPSQPDDGEMDELAILYREGQYDAVMTMCEALLAEHPGDAVLLRVKGVTLMDMGRIDAAVAVLEEALALHSDSISVRYFLAQAYAYKGHLASALDLLGAILDQAPDSAYAEQARAILPRIEGMMQTVAVLPDKRRWNVYLGISADYDENVPARAKRDLDHATSRSWRMTTSFYGEIRPLDQEVSRSPCTLGLGYSLYSTVHERDIFENYDVLSHRGSIFSERRGSLFSRHASARLTGNYAITEVGSEPYNESIEVELENRLWWTRRGMLQVHGSWEKSDYEIESEFPEYFALDGTAWVAGLRHYLHLWDHRLRLGVEYAYRDSDTDGSQFRQRSHQGGASLLIMAPRGLRTMVSARYAERDYIDFIPDPRRIDDVWNGSVSLAYAMMKSRLEVRAGYNMTRSRSSQDYAAYDREILTLGLNMSL